MRRFFVTSDDIGPDTVVIRDDEARHIKNVVRMRTGDLFVAFDGTGIDYVCRITELDRHVKAQIVSKSQNMTEPNVRVTLYQAYPKSAKMEEIVQKAVELGAAGIVPFVSSRCVKRPDDAQRLRRVALEAVKQCGRSVIPAVSDILDFDGALAHMAQRERLIVCWEQEQRTAIRQALQKDAGDIGVVIGSEGGFTEDEVRRMEQAGGVTATMGRRILRTETAGIAALSAIFYDKDQMRY